MEAETFNKDLIHGTKKKRKGKKEGSIMYENVDTKDNQERDDKEKRKSKKRKRKQKESENHEKTIADEFHEIKLTKENYMDVEKGILESEVNVEKIKSKKKSNNNVINFEHPEVLKKQKKKKRLSIEKLNSEEDSNERSKDFHIKKNKKCKKKKAHKKDVEISNTPIEIMKENIEDCIQDEETIEEETNTEAVHSLYSHEYTNETNRLNSRNDTSEPFKKKKKTGKSQNVEMYEDFLYKKPVIDENLFGDIEKIPEKDSYWATQNAKYDVKNYPQEEMQENLLERIEYIADYFDRFASCDLTEEECQEKELSDFKGPYLPTPQHIRFFGDLNIELDWDIPAEQQLIFSFGSSKELIKNGVYFVRHPFLRSEDEILLDNWNKFKEQYRFYDLRPLVGFRTMKVEREGRFYRFEPVTYVDPTEKYNFLLYMARGLENRARFQVLRRIIQISMRIHDNEISYLNSLFEPKEVAEIEAFIKLFGTDYRGMEFFLGRVNYMRYGVFSKIHIKYKNMPIRIGQWQSTEKSRLVRSIFKATNASSIKELLNSRVAWQEVFPCMQTRLTFHCQSYFKNHIKRHLELASNLANQETDSANIYWTSNDMVKLIKLVSENLGPTVDLIDWEKISSHFKLFGKNCCLYSFRRLYYRKVPRNTRSNLKEGVDYLLKYIIPQLEKGLLMFRKDTYTLDELRSLPLKKDQPVKNFDKWSLKNTIKLIKEVYENAGSSLETTNWNEISSHFKKYDERYCRNHFRYLYFNRVPHQHRASFDSALEYLRNIICPMLEHKKKRNRRESLLTEEAVNLSTEDRLILQSLFKDIGEADDDEDIAMLQVENDTQSKENNSKRIARMNALAEYIQEKHEEDDIDGDVEDIENLSIDAYIDDLDKEENKNLSTEGEITERSSLYNEFEDNSNEDSETDEIRSEASDKEKQKIMQASTKNLLRRTHDLSEEET